MKEITVAELNRQILEEYERKSSWPTWYHGQSYKQLDGEISLLTALRDDIETGTVSNVRSCLLKLGLEPLIKNREIKQMIHLSRGNDLAFVYFLNEMYYKVPDEERKTINGLPVYTQNEQLLMTTIFHLDIIPTLRELDRILPPGHPSIKTLKEREEIAKKKALKKAKSQNLKQKRSKICEFPYFQAQVLPKPYGKLLAIDRPKSCVNFHFYENYANPKYVIKNEESRWYANYNFRPELRASKSVVDNILSDAFDNHIHSDECLQNRACEQYKVIYEVEKILYFRYRSIAADKCLCIQRVGCKKWEERLNVLITKLEKDIQDFLNNYIKLRTKTKDSIVELKLISGSSVYFNSYADLRTYLQNYKQLFNSHRKYEEYSQFPNLDFGNKPKLIKIIIEEDGKFFIEGLTKQISKEELSKKTHEDCGDYVENLRTKPCNKRNRKHLIGDCKSTTENFALKPKKHDLLEHQQQKLDASSICSKDTFFTAPTKDMPYNFNYKKIFNLPIVNNNTNTEIKKAFLMSLNEGLDNPYKISETELKYKDLNDAVRHCANNIFQKTVAAHDKSNKEFDIGHNNCKKVLFSRKYYDYEDENLMKQMIEEAFQIMRQNPKFVLVTLPKCECLTVFLDFVKRRYGKIYTDSQSKTLLKESETIFEAIVSSLFDTIKLNLDEKFGWIEYSNINCVRKEIKPIINSYLDSFYNAILKKARTLWLTCRPFHNAYLATKNAFYSYTPSSVKDIQFFRVWRSHEYRDMSQYSRRRYIKILSSR